MKLKNWSISQSAWFNRLLYVVSVYLVMSFYKEYTVILACIFSVLAYISFLKLDVNLYLFLGILCISFPLAIGLLTYLYFIYDLPFIWTEVVIQEALYSFVQTFQEYPYLLHIIVGVAAIYGLTVDRFIFRRVEIIERQGDSSLFFKN